MVDKGVEYTVRDFSAVDTQVAEMAKREKLLTWRLRIENLKRLGMPLIYFAAALAIVIIALGIFFWLIQKERVVEVDKVVEVVKEVPVATEKLKIVEVPVYVETPVEKVVEVTKEVPVVSEKLKIVEVPVYVETSPAQGNSSILNIQVSDSLEVSKLKKEAGSSACANNSSYSSPCIDTYQYSSGTVYSGSWKNGLPEGNGKLTFENGLSIDGTWKEGKLQKLNNDIMTQSQLKQSKSIGLNLPKVDKQAGSNSCAKNSSHKVQCSDTYKYENGFKYVGSWYRGYPHGKGKVTFQDGSSIDGFWQNGALQRVKEQINSSVKALKQSVTIFNSVSGKQVNPAFTDIVAGHQFESGTAETWNLAYCYVNLIDDGEQLRIDLSVRSSYDINSRPSLDKYKSNSRYSLSDFSEAQDRCPYQWYGFN